ncbi:hypothetical protein PS673_02062 [Pseudomonas fluorescens]|uniref:Uncharacterized protein n=2 Tax=Pseudomonas fluorescens TaxID=294 RepID=A0A5E6S7R2_PSEFL|nr:hypothetical protein PS673_02062 [Pseudomonas fluorescens]
MSIQVNLQSAAQFIYQIQPSGQASDLSEMSAREKALGNVAVKLAAGHPSNGFNAPLSVFKHAASARTAGKLEHLADAH